MPIQLEVSTPPSPFAATASPEHKADPPAPGTRKESPVASSEDHISYVTHDYAIQILSILNDLRKGSRFCDVKLLCGDSEFIAQKAVLAASSPFFKSIFENKQAESPFATVTITGITVVTLTDLLDFAYTGNISVGADNVKDLFSAASSLQFQPVKDACSDYLQRHFSPENSVGIRYFALLEECKELAGKAEDFIARNFTDVTKCEEFAMLNFDQVSEIVDLQKYPFRNEQAVAIALFSWLHHDLEQRKKHFKELFKLIQLDKMSVAFIVSGLMHNELVLECPDSREAVLMTIANQRILSDEKEQVERVLPSPPLIHPVPLVPSAPASRRRHSSPSRRRKRSENGHNNFHHHSNNNHHIDKKGGLSAFKRRSSSAESTTITTTATTTTSTYHHIGPPALSGARHLRSDSAHLRSDSAHLRSDSGRHHLVMSSRGETTRSSERTITERERGGGGGGEVLPSGEMLFVVGGACNVNMADAIDKVECYSPATDTWHTAAPLRKSRSLVGVTVLRGKLYAVGGFDGISPVDSVESYSSDRNAWTNIGRMISARRGAGVTSAGERMYAIGGFDGTKLLNLCEVYHGSTNSWEPIANLKTCRFALGSATLNNRIFAVGGFDGQCHLSTVEEYDAGVNAWKGVAAMSMSRYAVGVAALNGAVYAVGGLDGTRPLATVERYDPRTDKWASVADMNTQRAGVDVAAIGQDLYAVGGILGSSPLQTVEKLDTRANKWCYVANMTLPRVDAGTACLLLD